MDLDLDRGMRILYIPIVYHRQMNPIRPQELSAKKRERCVRSVSSVENEDSDEEGCFLRIREGPSSERGPKLRNRSSVSSRKVARNNLETLLRKKTKAEDTNGVGMSHQYSETSPEKVVKKRFTLKRQK